MFEMFKKKTVKPVKVVIKPITDIVIPPEPGVTSKKASKLPVVTQTYDPLAVTLTNNLIAMVEEFEANIDRIEKHPGLSKEIKLDIQNYINKNLVTTLWALSPAFDLMASYPRIKIFKALHNKAASKGAPGILNAKKYV